MYVCIAYMHVHTNIYIYTCEYINMNIFVYRYMYIHINILGVKELRLGSVHIIIWVARHFCRRRLAPE